MKLSPHKSLNKAWLKVKPNRADIERFKTNLVRLLDQINEAESEEHHKNLVSDFLKDTWYKENHSVNTKGRNDLVIHNGKESKTTVGVIIEAKKPTNKAEMVKVDNLNTKAFQELVLYYLRERITHKNLEVKHLVATNIYEWFVFDAQIFEKAFAQNKGLVQQFIDFEEGRLSGKETDFFYKEIAKPAIAQILAPIPSGGDGGGLEFTHFDFRDYDKALRNADKADDKKLIALFKLLSPEHLLKLPFANDSNSLDKVFYSELLHIIGLTETKEGGKKLIGRKKKEDRNPGSLLENAIEQLDNLDRLIRIDKPSQYGDSHDERLFAVGLELVITWINRILFLKLLEAQLIGYHRGDKNYAFLDSKLISNYDDLESLFFSVLARKPEDRSAEVKQRFAHVPYLNSSLFEPTNLEHESLFISNLKNDRKLPLTANTVLKDANGKRLSGEMNALEYLFEFLNSYDFSSEGSEEIQEENKRLINASVLGLIFEKINGYKDGSFFTPGFITMYMCRETIRRAVLQKFNEAKGWNVGTMEELRLKIEDKKEANSIFNTLKICDPAVGSGHFLVSALNEMIAIKSELNILLDLDGRPLRDYLFEVENDELVISDKEFEETFYYIAPSPRKNVEGKYMFGGDSISYTPDPNKIPERQRVQMALFHEKQTLIENCLFGVDINPNSVKICRLRLWIELLKNAYYKPESNYTELETLPNIDINIKCGNSLISRFALDADLKQALRSSKWNMDTYKIAVQNYRHAKNREEKRDMERLIADIKGDFRSEISKSDPRVKKLSQKSGELWTLLNQTQIFEPSKAEQKANKLKKEKLEQEIEVLTREIEDIKSNKIYENAFEWRFEFPEVLNNEGDFVGFDVVIGNPPYIRQEEISWMKPYLQSHFATFSGTADLYVYFVEKGMNLLNPGGHFVYILPNKWMKGGYGKELRKWAVKKETPMMVDFGDLPVFDEATTYPSIWMMRNKIIEKPGFKAALVETLNHPEGLENYLQTRWKQINGRSLTEESWNLVDNRVQQLLDKIKAAGKPLGEYVNGKIYRGLLTGLNEAFVIDLETKERLIAEDPKSAELIKPFLAGRDIKRYSVPVVDKWIILIPKGFTIKSNLKPNDSFELHEAPPRYGSMEYDPSWEWLKTNYPAIANHLKPFEKQAKARLDQGDFWWELRACDYYGAFEKPKILFQEIAAYPTFVFENDGVFLNNKLFMIPTEELALVGFLNSKLTWFFLNQTAPILRGALALQTPFVLALPLHQAILGHSEITLKVQHILNARKEDSKVDVSVFENQIDQLVYQLYGLTEEEIMIVEG